MFTNMFVNLLYFIIKKKFCKTLSNMLDFY